jgi:hypothetical protein
LGNCGCRIRDKTVRGRHNFDGIDECKRSLLGLEKEGESITGNIKEIFLENQSGVIFDKEVV